MPANYTTTTRNALRALLGTSQGLDIDAGMAALALDVDSKMMGYREGLAEEKPPAGQAPGRMWHEQGATKDLAVDVGSKWQKLPLGERGALSINVGFGASSHVLEENEPFTPDATRLSWVVVHALLPGANPLIVTSPSWASPLVYQGSKSGSPGQISTAFLCPPGVSFTVNARVTVRYSTFG